MQGKNKTLGPTSQHRTPGTAKTTGPTSLSPLNNLKIRVPLRLARPRHLHSPNPQATRRPDRLSRLARRSVHGRDRVPCGVGSHCAANTTPVPAPFPEITDYLRKWVCGLGFNFTWRVHLGRLFAYSLICTRFGGTPEQRANCKFNRLLLGNYWHPIGS